MRHWIDDRWVTYCTQIHDKMQATDFANQWGDDTEVAFVRFEEGRSGGLPRRFVDVLLYHPHANRVFVLLAGVIEADGRIRFPDLVRGWRPEILDRVAATIQEQIASSPPRNLDLRVTHRSCVPFDVNSLTVERVLPGVRDYCTAVNHIKRYRFALDHVLPGRIIDCACGTGYGASILMHRRNINGYVGVDLSDFAVGFSRKLVPDTRCEFVKMPLAEVDQGRFENVVSLETIEHTPDPHAFLGDLAAKLAPDGQLILSLPAERWGGSHRNPYHLTNWTYARFERMVSARFRDVKIYKQKLSLLGPDTFGASEIFDRPCDEREDECFIGVLRGPKPQLRPRVVLRRRNAIGDTIWMTPVVSAARRRFPDCEIVAVTDETQVFLRNPDADIVATTAFQAREGDRVIDLDGSYEADRDAHLLEAYRSTAGIPLDTIRPALYPGEEDYRPVIDAIRNLRWSESGVEWIVSVHMAASSPDRIWPIEHWRTFLGSLMEDKRVGVICVGGPKDFDPEMLQLRGEALRRILSVRNTEHLLVSAAAIAISDLFVGPDSGMSHVAASFGTRGLVLYGMADPRTRIPFDGSFTPIWADVECRGCLAEIPPDQPPLCKFGRAICLDRIDPSLVSGKARGILESIPPRTWERRVPMRSLPSIPAVRNADSSPRAPRARPPVSTRDDTKIRVAVFSLDEPERACPEIRLYAPLRLLKEEVVLRSGVTLQGREYRIHPDTLADADMVVFPRFFPCEATWPFIEHVLGTRLPVVYELDDLLFDIPPANPNRGRASLCAPYIEKLMRACTAVTVSTRQLAQEVTPFNRRVHVLPNLLDEEVWGTCKDASTFPPISKGREPDGPLVIGYMGTPTHGADLGHVEDALRAVSDRYGNRVRFLFMGCATDRMMRLPGVTSLPFSPSYREYANALRRERIDIAIAPLEDNRFNRCKSNIKWLEYSACGIPGVYSDLPPYRSSVDHGRTGFLVGGGTRHWIDAIDRLIRNPEERFSIAKAARAEVATRFTLSARGRLYLDAYRDILGTRGRKSAAAGSHSESASVTRPPSVPAPGNRKPGESDSSAGGTDIAVSIVIPLFNRVEYTRNCIAALSRTISPGDPVEIVLIDNGSTDGTREFLDSIGGNVVVVRNPRNLGFAAACNQGARVSRGRNIVFLNNDTEPRTGWLKALLRAAEEENAAICGARLLYPDGRVQHAGVAFNENGVGYHIFNGFPGDHAAVVKRRRCQAVTGACMFVRRELFERLGGFDEGYRNGFEDVDFCLRAGEAGFRVAYVPECVVVHHEETSEGRKAHDRENLERFLRRWKGKVTPDEDRYYAEEGLRVQRDAEGKKIVTVSAGGPEGRGREDASSPDVCEGKNTSHPGDPAAMGRALKKEKRYAEAVEAFRRARENGDRTVLSEIGDCLAQEGKLEDAERAYTEAVSEDPCDPRALSGLGVLDLVRGNLDRARERFDAAIEADGRNPAALCGMGLLLRSAGKPEEAIGWFRRALDADPVNLVALHELVKTAHETGRFDEAERCLSGYLRFKPSDPHILFSLAGTRFRSGKAEEALDALDRLAFFDPSYEGADALRARIESHRLTA